MPQDVPDLSAAERERISEVLAAWARAHPRPHLPLIQLLDGSELTPIDIGDAALDAESRHSQLLYRVFAASQIEDGLEAIDPIERILTDFEHDTVIWREQGEGRGDFV